jgi:hypothetical protein
MVRPREYVTYLGGNYVTPRAVRPDCEDRLCSLFVLGCGLAAVGVTRKLTGFVPWRGLVHPQPPAPARLEELA